MSIVELKQLVPPPDRPFNTGDLVKWRKIEEQLGVELPPDYREFIFAYGTGLFAGFYRVYNPFTTRDYLALLPQSKRVCGYGRESRRWDPERFPYLYYPEAGGLLPWGNDTNGNDYFWLTEGAPAGWVVVQDENRGRGITVQPYSLTGFLVAILRRKIEALASGYPCQSNFTFEPWDTRESWLKRLWRLVGKRG
jgi:hypothetical protein